jgi:hypothetical protein
MVDSTPDPATDYWLANADELLLFGLLDDQTPKMTSTPSLFPPHKRPHDEDPVTFGASTDQGLNMDWPSPIFPATTASQAQTSNPDLGSPFNSRPMSLLLAHFSPVPAGLSSSRSTQNRKVQHGPHAWVNGVQASRRDRPLPEVTVRNPNDPREIKQAQEHRGAA